MVAQRARVRRAVVVHLISTMVESQHPTYTRVDLADMERRASHLPLDGIPQEIVAIVTPHHNTNNLLKQRQLFLILNCL